MYKHQKSLKTHDVGPSVLLSAAKVRLCSLGHIKKGGAVPERLVQGKMMTIRGKMSWGKKKLNNGACLGLTNNGGED